MAEQSPEEAEDDEQPADKLEEVNFAAWLKGQTNYNWNMLQQAGKRRYAMVWGSKKQMVIELVFDHRVVPEDQVCPALTKYLQETAAA